MSRLSEIPSAISRLLNLIWVSLYAFFSRRKIYIYIQSITERIPNQNTDCTVSVTWVGHYSGHRRRANAIQSIPMNHRSWLIATSVQLAEELVRFTFHLGDTAVFIYLSEDDMIPLIIKEK